MFFFTMSKGPLEFTMTFSVWMLDDKVLVYKGDFYTLSLL